MSPCYKHRGELNLHSWPIGAESRSIFTRGKAGLKERAILYDGEIRLCQLWPRNPATTLITKRLYGLVSPQLLQRKNCPTGGALT
jgi:hypothetical protein